MIASERNKRIFGEIPAGALTIFLTGINAAGWAAVLAQFLLFFRKNCDQAVDQRAAPVWLAKV